MFLPASLCFFLFTGRVLANREWNSCWCAGRRRHGTRAQCANSECRKIFLWERSSCAGCAWPGAADSIFDAFLASWNKSFWCKFFRCYFRTSWRSRIFGRKTDRLSTWYLLLIFQNAWCIRLLAFAHCSINHGFSTLNPRTPRGP